jgi:hypothetical protein
MSEAQASSLRRALSSHTGGRGRRYPRVLRERIVAYAQVRRAESASWARIAAELELQYETVRRWCLDANAVVASRAILPVEVVGDLRASLAVVAPSGLRIEGVTLADAIAVLRALG